ncbi:hypothetical protein BDP27DRAFT_745805 [Rhodocollybia butyracea]|uniref:Uncharacterized protein n=1 Tax=Rhodocollybia butyracea TaxID=206335 RepID=A0A9P5PTK9_9AGAR|nr:hypothetical protein BDP27DRAFT_745805 [Rhodocollybia butyracea]
MPHSLSLLSLYMSRSDSLPLAVYLDLKPMQVSSEETTDFAPVFSAMLFLSSRRWVSLSLAGNLPAAFSNDSFPLLKHIQSEEEDIRVDDLIDITAPRLQSWSTMGHKLLPVMITMSPTLCSQITEYAISHVDALKIIEQLQCLSKPKRVQSVPQIS